MCAAQRIIRILAVALAGLLLIAAPSAYGHETKGSKCDGNFKGGKKPTPEELSKILTDHSEWLKGSGRGQQADLCEADLSGANLSGANLRQADLESANLSRAYLEEADLHQAVLVGADLRQARLFGFRGANLSEVNLFGADLRQADLRYVNLIGANLSEVDLSGAELSEADLSGANLAFSVFEPRPGSLPVILTVARATNLSKMTFGETPASMVELREEFKKRGLRNQEREITFAIRHTERIKLREIGLGGKIESAFQYILFEITSDYGMSPWRPLLIVVIFIPLFSIPYMFGLGGRRSGIWAVLPAERVHKGRTNRKPIRVTTNFPIRRKGPLARWFRILRIALYFSLLSAFRIGWRELNIGNWITRLQCREYILRATGWVRFVSGLQSLISVYLIALWILTYFGRPFE